MLGTLENDVTIADQHHIINAVDRFATQVSVYLEVHKLAAPSEALAAIDKAFRCAEENRDAYSK
ncbi:MAG: hypothetical protein WA906_12900 [Pacificimonas sp.]